MVSEWSAWCKRVGDPMSCMNELQSPDYPPDFRSSSPRFQAPGSGRPDYGWTDLTYLLHAHHVSWAYYVMAGTEPDCANDRDDCGPVQQKAKTPGIWNPLPFFDTVKRDGRARQHPRPSRFLQRRGERHAAQRRVDLPGRPV